MNRFRTSLCATAATVLLLGGLFAPPARAGGLSERSRRAIDSLLDEALAQRAFPGASVVIGDRSGVIFERTCGHHDYSRTQPVLRDDLYDIASCTKVFSTTFVLMRLCDEGLVAPDHTLGRHLSEYAGTPLGRLTLQELLTHTSGLKQISPYRLLVKAPGTKRLFSPARSAEYPHHVERNLYMAREVELDPAYLSESPSEGCFCIGSGCYVNPAVDTLLTAEIIRKYSPESRGRYLYTDSNFYLLRLVAERVTGRGLDELSAALFAELGCADTGYRPLEWADTARVVPTEEDWLLRRGLLRGYVHDDLTALSGGVGGNAGLFSTAGDLGRFCRMIVQGGAYGGRQIVSDSTVRLFLDSPLEGRGVYRGLGFDKRKPGTPLGGADRAGHTGFTGGIFWLDRARGYYLVFLSNRVHPTRTNNRLTSSGLRTRLWELLVEGYREEE